MRFIILFITGIFLFNNCEHNPETFEVFNICGSWQEINRNGEMVTLQRVEQLDACLYGIVIMNDFQLHERWFDSPCSLERNLVYLPGTWQWLDEQSVQMNIPAWNDTFQRIMVIEEQNTDWMQVRYVHEKWLGEFPFIHDMVCGLWVEADRMNSLVHYQRMDDGPQSTPWIDINYDGEFSELYFMEGPPDTLIQFSGTWQAETDSTFQISLLSGAHSLSKDYRVVSVDENNLYMLIEDVDTFYCPVGGE